MATKPPAVPTTAHTHVAVPSRLLLLLLLLTAALDASLQVALESMIVYVAMPTANRGTMQVEQC
jgi:hypothetical protein